MNNANKSRRAPFKYDVVYYWSGGTDNGRWNAADPNTSVELGGCGGDIDALVSKLTRAGYKCVKGNRSIGAPEGYEYIKRG